MTFIITTTLYSILIILLLISIITQTTMSTSTHETTPSSTDNGSISTSTKNNHYHHLHKRGKIILLGDSITQMSTSAALSGWGSYIADIYQRRCDVYNRGMSGYNTKWFLKYLETNEGYHDVFGMMKTRTGEEQVDDDNNVKLVTIFFGANDASSSTLNPRHHVPIPEFKSNLKIMIQKCYENYDPKVNIILITPPPVCHESRLEYQIQRYKDKATGVLERTLELSGDYAKAVVDVGGDMNVNVLNIWELMQNSDDNDEKKNENDDDATTTTTTKKHPWSKYLSDGLHLSREGNLFVGEHLIALINKAFPDIAVTPCPHTDYTGNSSSKGGTGLGSDGGAGIGPWHDEIDYLNVDSAFFGTVVPVRKNSKKTEL